MRMSEAEPTLHQTIEDLTTQAVQLGRDRFGIALDFSLTSLPKLGKLLDQARDSYLAGNVSEQGLDRTVLVWGAYLGETQRRNKGGSWKTDPTKTGDRRIYLFTKRINIYPFEQVRQKITGIEPVMPDRDELPVSPEQVKKTITPRQIILTAVGMIVVLILAAIAVLLVNQRNESIEKARQQAMYEASFLPYFAEYLAEYSSIPGDTPDITGKVVAIDKASPGVVSLQYLLPDRIKAANPDEVNLVAQIVCFATDDEADATLARTACNLTLVDPSKGKVVAQQEFAGKNVRKPAQVSTYHQAVDVVRAVDAMPIVKWLDETIK
jgi:hypothetical protein